MSKFKSEEDIWEASYAGFVVEFFVVVFGAFEEKLWVVCLGVSCALIVWGITLRRLRQFKLQSKEPTR